MEHSSSAFTAPMKKEIALMVVETFLKEYLENELRIQDLNNQLLASKPVEVEPLNQGLFNGQLRGKWADCTIGKLRAWNRNQRVTRHSRKPLWESSPTFFRESGNFHEDCFRGDLPRHEDWESQRLSLSSSLLVCPEQRILKRAQPIETSHISWPRESFGKKLKSFCIKAFEAQSPHGASRWF